MTRRERETTADRLRITLDLMDLALQMKRQNLRRARPRASDAQIDRALTGWLESRPGDGVGEPGRWPRRQRR